MTRVKAGWGIISCVLLAMVSVFGLAGVRLFQSQLTAVDFGVDVLAVMIPTAVLALAVIMVLKVPRSWLTRVLGDLAFVCLGLILGVFLLTPSSGEALSLIEVVGVSLFFLFSAVMFFLVGMERISP